MRDFGLPPLLVLCKAMPTRLRPLLALLAALAADSSTCSIASAAAFCAAGSAADDAAGAAKGEVDALGESNLHAVLLANASDDGDEDGLARVLGITAAESPASEQLAHESLKDRVSDFERQLIEKALADANSNISEAARLLGVKRTTLIEKMGRLNIAKR